MKMKVRLTTSTPFLKEFYNLEEGIVLKVLKIVHRKRHSIKLKKWKKKWRWLEKLYVVQVRNHYPDNFQNKLQSIYLTENECMPTTFKLDKI